MRDINYYKKIQNAYGSNSLKQTTLREAKMHVNNDFKNSLNWERSEIDGHEQEVLITRGENATVKKIKSRPNEHIKLGALVKWAHTYWLVTKMDYDDQLHSSGVMNQCNVILKWQLADRTIVSEYGVAEDATKYGTGITNTVYLQIGEFSIKVKVPLNEQTLAIKRDQRFLIGYAGNGFKPQAFITSRINQVTGTYALNMDNSVLSDGYIEITMLEDQFRPGKDNVEYGIADYKDIYGDSSDEEPVIADEPAGVLGESGWFG